MKNLIRQILREETSGLTDGQIKAGYSLMNHLTKGYRLYSTPYATWLINPETKEWVVELEKEGRLWWNIDFYLNFERYFNMEMSDYKKFIKIWVEDVLNRGVSSTLPSRRTNRIEVEDVLNRGVSSTRVDGGKRFDFR